MEKPAVSRMAQRATPESIEETLDRWPRLTAHLICGSLGYFTPQAAANAILHYRRGEPFLCEWYTHMAGFNREKLLDVGRKVLEHAFRSRHHHRGYMAHYPQARALVEHVRRGGEGPLFASWF
jgi:hypothetical protein